MPNQGKGKTNGANAWSGGSLQTTVQIGNSGATSLQLAPSAIIPGEISGLKFSDLNNNSTMDAGEPGLASWTICLDSDSDPNNGNLGCVLTSNGTTDDQDGNGIIDPVGFYYFSVTPGTYYVREVNQDNWTQTLPTNGYYGPLVVSATTPSYTNQNFGNYYCLPPDLSDASLTLCAATPGGTTATFDLTTATTGVNTTTMTVVYKNGNTIIDTPTAYTASNGATVTVTAYFNGQSATCTDVATITLHVQPVPDLADATLTLCAAAPGGTTATFDLTTAATGVTSQMTVVYKNGNTIIDTPAAYTAANNATVTVTAYYTASAATCTDVATITLHVQPVPDLSDATLTLCAAAPGGTTATF
ncbi:MAG TPA: hypothetical protein VGK10_08280, partial [Prolixibacteraceae bacterium]